MTKAKEKYLIKTSEIANKPGQWVSTLVEIFEKTDRPTVATKIGEYKRDYHAMFDTFHPFTLGGKDYALYSKNYTATRVMSLPDCKDLGGEEPKSNGFCPTGYYVPEINIPANLSDDDPEPDSAQHSSEWVHRYKGGAYYPSSENHPRHNEPGFREAYAKAVEESSRLRKEWDARHPYETVTAPFGFVSGCIWGDDSSWKIEYLDLSRVAEGIITRDARFGYIELPPKMKLADAIDVSNYDYDSKFVHIAVDRRFDIDGEEVE